MKAEKLAKLIHETYQELTSQFIYRPQDISKRFWEEVRSDHQELMIAVAKRVLSTRKKQTADDCIENCAVVDENTQLKKDLLKYSRHTRRCASRCIDSDDPMLSSFLPCNCGLSEILQ